MLNEFLGDGPIAGSSFTEEVGTAKWQKPPKIVSPVEAFETFIEILGRGDNYDKVVFCMEEGLPIEGITNSIVNNMVAEGVITYDVALLMTPEVARVLEAIANKEEVEYVLELPRQINTKFVEAKIKKITGEEDSSEEPEEIEEEEEEVQEETERKGLMGA